MDFLPRLIFISDMGDALSTNIQFPDLKREIIDPVVSTAGQRHYWLWLSKRPSRMAEFATWLTENYKTEWPENLVTMTTVTSCKTLGRIDALRQVPSRFKGVSMEPVFEPVQARLEGIDWLIIGGGSDVRAEPFYAEWALGMQAQCQNAGIACFIKQLGRNPHFQNKPMRLSDPHGGDWNEWPNALRWRQFPVLFCQSPAQLPIKPDRRTK